MKNSSAGQPTLSVTVRSGFRRVRGAAAKFRAPRQCGADRRRGRQAHWREKSGWRPNAGIRSHSRIARVGIPTRPLGERETVARPPRRRSQSRDCEASVARLSIVPLPTFPLRRRAGQRNILRLALWRPSRLKTSIVPSFRGYRTAARERDSVGSAACDACGSVAGEQQPHLSTSRGSIRAKQLWSQGRERLRYCLLARDTRLEWGREQGWDRRKGDGLPTRLVLARLCQPRPFHPIGVQRYSKRAVVSKSRRMPARARHGSYAGDHEVRSFASSAARVLRSVRSRWHTGWRRTRAGRSPAQ